VNRILSFRTKLLWSPPSLTDELKPREWIWGDPDAKLTEKLRIEDVTLVGGFERLEKSQWEKILQDCPDKQERKALKMLRRTSNIDPPPSGSPKSEWVNFARSKSYRCLLRLESIHAEFSTDCQNGKVSASVALIRGFTPTPWIRRPHWDSEGATETRLEPGALYQEIVASANMRIGEEGQKLARFHFGVTPSFTEVQLKLRFDSSGRHSLRVAASAVPSLTLYMNRACVGSSSSFSDLARGLRDFLWLDNTVGPMSLRIEHPIV
jgi:hypothetical protein